MDLLHNDQDTWFSRNRGLGASTTPPLNTCAGPPLATKLVATTSGSVAHPPPAAAVVMPPPAQVSAVSKKRSYSTKGSSSLHPISILDSNSDSSGFLSSFYCTGKVEVKPKPIKSEFKLPPLPKRRKGSSVAATPLFGWEIRKEAIKQSVLGTHSASKQKALDLLPLQLTAENTGADAMALKKRAKEMENICPNGEQTTESMAKFVQRRELFPERGKDAVASDSLKRPATSSTGLKHPAAVRGHNLGLGLKHVTKRPALSSKKPITAAKKAPAVASKKASSPGGLSSQQPELSWI